MAALFALLAFFCGHALAQTVPALINYQGQLTDASGNPLPTADYVLIFSIHNAATGDAGTQVWGSQIFDGGTAQGHGPKIPVVQGFFNVMLGPVDVNGTPINDAFNASNRFVEIQIAGHNPITPRQRILSAPYAVRAESAEKLKVPGGAADAVTVAANGNVGVGTVNPQSKLDIANGSVRVDISPSISSDGSVSGEAYPLGLSTTHHGAGSTGWPQTYGTVFTVKQGGGRMFQYDVFASDPGDGTYLRSFYTPDWSPFRKVHVEGPAGVPGDSLFAGNVGIGVTNPSARLEVAGQILASAASSPGVGVFLKSAVGPASYSWLIGAQEHVDGGLEITPSTAPGGTTFSTPALTVKASGNIGIGTTSPSAKLEVAGTVKATAFEGNGTVPPGSIMAYGGATPPAGWLLCDGSTVNRTGTYAALYGAIGTSWGVGNGSSTFTVPDLRGHFLRGRDGGVGRDPNSGTRTNIAGATVGDVVGSYQPDEFRSHRHDSGGNPGTYTDNNRFPLNVITGRGLYHSSGNALGMDTAATGGSETRPKNAYVNYIIKY